MTKAINKIAGIVMVITMLIGTFAFSGCNNVKLEDYKVIKITELQAYADAKGQDNYSEENWITIIGFVEEGKTAIESVESKAEVDAGFVEAKQSINNVLTTAQEFTIYKSKAIECLQAYPEESGGLYYFDDENWAAMLQLAEDGKEEINKAATNDAVDLAVIQAKQAMDLVEEKDGVPGKFYSLQEAYDEGWLTRQDLMNIAYYYDAGYKATGSGKDYNWYEGLDEDFVATPKSPESLSVRVTNRIRKTFVEEFFAPIIARISKDVDLDEARLTIDYVSIPSPYYYGIYNDVVAVRVSSNHYNYSIVDHKDKIVGGITFLGLEKLSSGEEPALARHKVKIWKAN